MSVSHKRPRRTEQRSPKRAHVCSLRVAWWMRGSVCFGPALMHFLISTSPFVEVLLSLRLSHQAARTFYLNTNWQPNSTHLSCSLLQAAAGPQLPGQVQKRLDVRALKGLFQCVESLTAVHSEQTARWNRAGRQVGQGTIVWSCFSSLQVGRLRTGSTDLSSDGPGTLSKNIKTACREVGTATNWTSGGNGNDVAVFSLKPSSWAEWSDDHWKCKLRQSCWLFEAKEKVYLPRNISFFPGFSNFTLVQEKYQGLVSLLQSGDFHHVTRGHSLVWV